MIAKPIVPRRSANRDIESAVDHYFVEGGEGVALDFVESLERAFGHIARHPRAGSMRYAHELDLPGLRVWPLRRFPYLVFYVERPDSIDIWRVLHVERDIPARMRAPDAG